MYKRILAALDGSRALRLALDEGIRIVKASGAEIVGVSVIEHADRPVEGGTVFAPGAERNRERLEAAGIILEDADELFEANGVKGSVRAVDAYGESVASVIARVAGEWEADLIVIGTHGRHGLRRAVLGSVAESVVRTAPTPVLLMRHGPDDDTGKERHSLT